MSNEIRKVQVAEGTTISAPTDLSLNGSTTSTGDQTYSGGNFFNQGPFTISSGHTYTISTTGFWGVVQQLTVSGQLIVNGNGIVRII